MNARNGTRWTRDETILALDLYMRMPFRTIHYWEKPVMDLAQKMGRTPSSLAMKMLNLARLDPTLAKRNVGGLGHGAKEEVAIWEEFASRIDALLNERDRILSSMSGESVKAAEPPVIDDAALKIPPGLEKERLQKVRCNQSYFRSLVMSSYDNTCCITGLNDSRLLIASHIKPWSDAEAEDERISPANGLCLNSLHDKAFDRGLITIDCDMKVVLSKSLRNSVLQNVFNEYFGKYEGMTITMPHHFIPDRKFIEYHNNHVFIE